MRRFIASEINNFGKFQLIKILDIYKYNSKFGNQKLKQLLEMQLETKVNERINDSEEEELKQLT